LLDDQNNKTKENEEKIAEVSWHTRLWLDGQSKCIYI
jgi:hypothetical protein